MSRENVEIVRKIYAAWNAADVEAVLPQIAPDIQLDLRERVFNPGVLEGHKGVRALFAEVPEAWEGLRIEVDELREVAERVIAVTTVIGKGRSSGVEIRWPSAHVWTLSDGEVMSFRMYRNPSEALEAVGLSE